MHRKIYSLDYVLIFFVLAVSIVGIITIGSTTHINVNGIKGNFLNQILWLISGIFLMLFLHSGIIKRLQSFIFLFIF